MPDQSKSQISGNSTQSESPQVLLDKLNQRFINGEISEATYLELKKQLESKLSN